MSFHAWPTEGNTAGGAGDKATRSTSIPISPIVHRSHLQPGETHQSWGRSEEVGLLQRTLTTYLSLCLCVRVMGTETQLSVYVIRLLQERDFKDDGNCGTDLCSLIESLTCYSSSRLQRLKQKLQVLTEINSMQTELCARPMPPANQILKKGISF